MLYCCLYVLLFSSVFVVVGLFVLSFLFVPLGLGKSVVLVISLVPEKFFLFIFWVLF
jgi:hypothetical protein